MADIARNLKILFEEIDNTKTITPSHVVYLMAKSRQYLEETQRFGDFPLLSFYCNWTLHTSISEAPRGMKMLRDLSMIAVDFVKSKDASGKHNDRICEIISIRELRKDFLRLTADLGVPKFLFSTKSIWDAFVGMLMRELTEKPIALVEPKEIHKFERLKKTYDKIFIETKEIGFIPIELKFSSRPGEVVQWFLVPAPESQFQDTYSGNLYFTEKAEDF